MATIERAKDPEGSIKAPAKSFGSSKGSSKKEGGGSASGVGGKLSSDTTKNIGTGPHTEESIEHFPAYRPSGLSNEKFRRTDPKYTGAEKPQTGLPRQEASYVNRDRQGSGLETNPAYQRKHPNYPGTKNTGKVNKAREEKKEIL